MGKSELTESDASAWNDLSPEDPEFAVKSVNRILDLAIDRAATDVHLHPRSDHWEVLYRIDGVLQRVAALPKSDQTDPVARLMVLAKLPSYRAGGPQEATINYDHGSDRIEMRLATFPTISGSRAVIRLLSRRDTLDQIDDLGFSAVVTTKLKRLCQQREGLILMVGPAGSGKTTTLYAALRFVAELDRDSKSGSQDQRRSVLTIEDPVEQVIERISQSQVNSDTGMTLASAMRSAVRQDPEVLLVSEIRDRDTAHEVLAASLTGHLCFSSLHAPDIPTSIYRLVQLGLPVHLIQSGLLAACTQRLFRRICGKCGRATPSVVASCDDCHGTGYSGRVAIAQMVDFTHDEVGQIIHGSLASGDTRSQMWSKAREAGMATLAELAQELIEDGLTDQTEVFRVLGIVSAHQLISDHVSRNQSFEKSRISAKVPRYCRRRRVPASEKDLSDPLPTLIEGAFCDVVGQDRD